MKAICPMNVFDVSKKNLRVKNLDNCTFCRECINDEELGSKISLAKEAGNYIFTIESVGSIDPVELLRKALLLIIKKAKFYKESVSQLN